MSTPQHTLYQCIGGKYDGDWLGFDPSDGALLVVTPHPEYTGPPEVERVPPPHGYRLLPDQRFPGIYVLVEVGGDDDEPESYDG